MADVRTALRRALVEDLRLGEATGARSWRARFATPLRGPPAAHAGIEIAWVRSGYAEYRIGRAASFVVHAGQIAIVPAEAEHTTALAGDLEAGALELGSEAAREIVDAMGGEGRLSAGIVSDAGDVRGVIGAIEEELHGEGRGRTLAIEALAEALLVRVLRGASATERGGACSSRPSDRRIGRALDYLQANASEPIGVPELARAAGMSRFHFSRVFRDELGASPYAYLMNERLHRAAARLRGGDCSVTTAALDAGFRDLGRFAKAFRARYGMTASAFISSTHPPSRRTRASS